jgi:Family of unknown function (DUF6644)
MSVGAAVEWLAGTRGSIALHESQYMYVIVESVHVLTLCLFVGFSALLDLRLLGWLLQRVPVSKIVARLMPWTVAGFFVMIVSGALLFYAIPVRSYHSIFFRIKVVLLALAGVNAWVFHSGIWLRRTSWDLDRVPPPRARAAGALSLVLWAAIIVAGRLIAYNWFDCDHPLPRIVVTLTGCAQEQQ